jgi:hypothetical protein
MARGSAARDGLTTQLTRTRKRRELATEAVGCRCAAPCCAVVGCLWQRFVTDCD